MSPGGHHRLDEPGYHVVHPRHHLHHEVGELVVLSPRRLAGYCRLVVDCWLGYPGEGMSLVVGGVLVVGSSGRS